MTLEVGSRRRVPGHGLGVVVAVRRGVATVALESELVRPPGAQRWTAREWLFRASDGEFLSPAKSVLELSVSEQTSAYRFRPDRVDAGRRR